MQESVRHLSEADAVDLRKQEVPVSKHEKHRARMVEEEGGVKPHVARVTGFKKTTTTAAKGGQTSNILPNDSTTGQEKIVILAMIQQTFFLVPLLIRVF